MLARNSHRVKQSLEDVSVEDESDDAEDDLEGGEGEDSGLLDGAGARHQLHADGSWLQISFLCRDYKCLVLCCAGISAGRPL